MLLDAAIVTDFERCLVHKTDAATLAETRAQISAQRHQRVWNPFDEALIANEPRKRLCPFGLHFRLIISFEVAVTRLMEGNQKRHDLAQAQAARSVPALESTSQKLLFPLTFKALAEIIDGAEQVF